MTFEDSYRAWKARKISQSKAAKTLGVSERTFRRYVQRYEQGGAEALIDKRISQGSPRRAPSDEIAEVVNTYKAGHEGWNVKQFYAWYLNGGGQRSYNWVRMQLQNAGAVDKLPRRGLHRTRFERAAIPGVRLHQDGYRYEWLSGSPCDLVITIDDATGSHYSMFIHEHEGTWSSFAGIRHVLERQGLFSSLYTDQAPHYRSGSKTTATGKQDPENLTQFERAMNQLGIKLIASRSAQVRTRCERSFGIHVHRLPAELSAAGITEISEANQYLEKVYRHAHNEEFRQNARLNGTAFEPCKNTVLLDDYLCEQHWRVVRTDNCVQFGGLLLKLPSDHRHIRLAKTRVMVRRHLNGSISISYGIRRIARYDMNGELIIQQSVAKDPPHSTGEASG